MVYIFAGTVYTYPMSTNATPESIRTLLRLSAGQILRLTYREGTVDPGCETPRVRVDMVYGDGSGDFDVREVFDGETGSYAGDDCWTVSAKDVWSGDVALEMLQS